MFTTFVSLLLFALFTAPGFYATVRIRGRYPAYDTAPTPWEQVAWATLHSLRSHAFVLVPALVVLGFIKFGCGVRIPTMPLSKAAVSLGHVLAAVVYAGVIFAVAEGFARRQMRSLGVGESSAVPLLHRVLNTGDPKVLQVYMRSGHVINGELMRIADNPKDFSSGIHDIVLHDVQIVGPEGNIVSEGEHTLVVNYRDVMFVEVVSEDDVAAGSEAGSHGD